jgi:hypothetical protein
MNKLLIFICILLSGCNYTNTRVVSNTYTLQESIDAKAYKDFKYHVENYKIYTLKLESYGGEIYNAIAIANLVEKYKIKVEVPLNKDCRSACTFILLAGYERDIKGMVGIHEPSVAGKGYRFTTGKQRKDLDNIKYDLVKLAERNGIKKEFILDSYNVPNEKMKYLTGKQFKDKYIKTIWRK